MPFQKGQSGNPSGRPRKADQNAGAVAKAEKRIRDRLPLLIDNMLALANGIYVEETDKDGVRFVYLRAPDRQANEYLINRIMGKPTERQEITGADGGPIEITAATRARSALELAEWRQQQIAALSNGLTARVMQVISSTTTDS